MTVYLDIALRSALGVWRATGVPASSLNGSATVFPGICPGMGAAGATIGLSVIPCLIAVWLGHIIAAGLSQLKAWWSA